MSRLLQAEAPAKKEKTVEEVTTLKNKVADGNEYFAVAHIFASFNDTFVVSIIQSTLLWPVAATRFLGFLF